MEEVRCAHLKAVFDNHAAMQNISYRLQRLATSFDATGNDKVADILWETASELVEWGDLVRDTHGDRQAKDLKRTQEATANILTAFISGIEKSRT